MKRQPPVVLSEGYPVVQAKEGEVSVIYDVFIDPETHERYLEIWKIDEENEPRFRKHMGIFDRMNVVTPQFYRESEKSVLELAEPVILAASSISPNGTRYDGSIGKKFERDKFWIEGVEASSEIQGAIPKRERLWEGVDCYGVSDLNYLFPLPAEFKRKRAAPEIVVKKNFLN
jgi:hypothetical protein